MDGQLARVAAAHERGTDAGTTKALALAAKQIATFSIFQHWQISADSCLSGQIRAPPWDTHGPFELLSVVS
jgi:hypothetical protein